MAIERGFRRAWLPFLFLILIGIAMGIDGLSPGAPIALLVATVAIGAVIAFTRPVDMLAVLAVSVPLQAYGALDVLGVSVTLTKLCIGCLAIGWLPRVAAGKRVPLDAVLWGYLAVAVALVVSVAAAPDGRSWAAELYRWAVSAFVFLVARSEISERRHVNRLLLGISAGVGGVSIQAIRQVIEGDGPPSFVVNGLLRAYGTFGQPNPLAAYLELSLPILTAMTVVPLVRRSHDVASAAIRVAMAMAIATGSVAMFLTQSRGGWLGIAAAGMVLIACLPLKIQATVAGVALGSLAGLFALGWGSVLTDRAFSMLQAGGDRVHVTARNWANEERRAHWNAALAMIRAHPWAGVGAGGFNDAFREYTSDWRFRVSRGHAHNGYLQMAAQAGVAGAVTFGIWILSILHTLLRILRDRRRTMRDGRAVGGLATAVAFAVHSMVDYLNVLSLGIQLALVIAIAMANISAETETRRVREGMESA